MSRFRKQSQTIWFCEYHIVWCPKYRYRVMQGKVKEEVEAVVREQSRQMLELTRFDGHLGGEAL